MKSLDDLIIGPATFMGAPHSLDLTEARAAILGIPFDCGIHPFRVGSRQGPQSIREQSRLIRPYNPDLADYNPLQRLGLVDCGDVRLTPGRISEALEKTQEALAGIVAHDVVPITFGGDGSVSHGVLAAMSRKYSALAVIHLDSHTDTAPPAAGNEYNAATQFHHAAVHGWIDPTACYHIGIRGTSFMQGTFPHARDIGYRHIITLDQLLERGIPEVVRQLQAALKGRPVYLCLDMDVFDPSCAPGVCAPSWGGLTAREGFQILRGLAGLNIVAADINTVSPPHDFMGMAGFLAAAMAYEVLVLLCRYHGLDRPGN